jgi:hypothetical protein
VRTWRPFLFDAGRVLAPGLGSYPRRRWFNSNPRYRFWPAIVSRLQPTDAGFTDKASADQRSIIDQRARGALARRRRDQGNGSGALDRVIRRLWRPGGLNCQQARVSALVRRRPPSRRRGEPRRAVTPGELTLRSSPWGACVSAIAVGFAARGRVQIPAASNN